MSGTPDDSTNPYRPTDPIDSTNPAAQPPPADSHGPPAAEARFGDHLNRAFSAYGAQWTQWPLPMLVAGLIFLASFCPRIMGNAALRTQSARGQTIRTRCQRR